MYLHTFCSSCGPTERISHSANFSRATREAAKSKLKTAAAATGAEQRQRHIDWVPTYVHTHTHARAHDDQRAMPAKESDKERERVESSRERDIMACERGYAWVRTRLWRHTPTRCLSWHCTTAGSCDVSIERLNALSLSVYRLLTRQSLIGEGERWQKASSKFGAGSAVSDSVNVGGVVY